MLQAPNRNNFYILETESKQSLFSVAEENVMTYALCTLKFLKFEGIVEKENSPRLKFKKYA